MKEQCDLVIRVKEWIGIQNKLTRIQCAFLQFWNSDLPKFETEHKVRSLNDILSIFC